MARLLLVCLAAFVLVAATCGGEGDDDDGVLLDTGIEGVVTIGPMCAVVQQDTPCPDEPFQAEIVIQDVDSGERVARFETAEDGTFSYGLMPGSYRLLPQWPNEAGPPTAQEQLVEVRAGAYTRVEIQFDSGIR